MGAADSSPAAADGAAASSHEPVANGPPRGLESGASADDDKATESTRLPSELEASSHRPELLKLRLSRTVAPVPWRYLALLTGLLIGITFAGGIAFEKLELPRELRDAKRQRSTAIERIKRIEVEADDRYYVFSLMRDDGPSDWRCGFCGDPSNTTDAEFEKEVHKICRGPGSIKHCYWLFDKAMFFTLSCYTTIGYGTFTPRTPGGKVMTVLVTGFGMIVALGLFSAIGTNLLFYLRHTSHPRWLGTFIFLFLVVYILLGATTFWAAGLLQGEPSYGDCVYFACVTLSTLGLGDYVPKNTRVFSNAFTFIFVAGGLSWASVSLQYAQLWCYPQHECMLRRHFDSDHFSDTPNADISTMTRVPRDAGAASSSSSTSAN